jgi:hypothetical protein
MLHLFVLALSLVSQAATAAAAAPAPAATLTTTEAKAHIGETATVCGKVESARQARTSGGQPTFLNLDKPYPDQPFTVVIYIEDRPKFGSPEERYQKRSICVTGRITEFRGRP